MFKPRRKFIRRSKVASVGGQAKTGETMVYLAMIRLMLKRLA
jgi:hypothetical protein